METSVTLPDDILLEIMRYADGKGVVGLASTCHHLYREVHHSQIHLQFTEAIPGANLVQLVNTFPNLQSFGFTDYADPILLHEDLEILAKSSSLRTLQLERQHNLTNRWPAFGFDALQVLHLTSSENVSNALCTIAEHCTALTELNIRDTDRSNDAVLRCLQRLRKLKHFDCSNQRPAADECRITDEDVQHLESLLLGSDDKLALSGALPNLKTFKGHEDITSKAPNLEMIYLDRFFEWNKVKLLTKLRAVHISAFVGPQFVVFDEAPPHLEQVDLSLCDWRKHYTKPLLTTTCPQLRVLSIPNSSIPKGLLPQTFALLPNLIALEISGSRFVNTDTVRMIAQSCPKLQVFLANMCTGVNDTGLHLLISHCLGLRMLHLIYTSVTDVSIRQLTELRALEIVDLSYTAATEQVVTELRPKLPQLKQLLALACPTQVSKVPLFDERGDDSDSDNESDNDQADDWTSDEPFEPGEHVQRWAANWRSGRNQSRPLKMVGFGKGFAVLPPHENRLDEPPPGEPVADIDLMTVEDLLLSVNPYQATAIRSEIGELPEAEQRAVVLEKIAALEKSSAETHYRNSLQYMSVATRLLAFDRGATSETIFALDPPDMLPVRLTEQTMGTKALVDDAHVSYQYLRMLEPSEMPRMKRARVTHENAGSADANTYVVDEDVEMADAPSVPVTDAVSDDVTANVSPVDTESVHVSAAVDSPMMIGPTLPPYRQDLDSEHSGDEPYSYDSEYSTDSDGTDEEFQWQTGGKYQHVPVMTMLARSFLTQRLPIQLSWD
eukprot:TRINITY_DN13867_c0_g1_i1.p1 TRINITY_DN13867_c0_g1~~TRINITY_DN13867_c0_g1_i1.p1  ORF type:complete len:781 (-),score=163.71 TRINITY_DN13867_c0_g1_i1:25-2367(-)